MNTEICSIYRQSGNTTEITGMQIERLEYMGTEPYTFEQSLNSLRDLSSPDVLQTIFSEFATTSPDKADITQQMIMVSLAIGPGNGEIVRITNPDGQVYQVWETHLNAAKMAALSHDIDDVFDHSLVSSQKWVDLESAYSSLNADLSNLEQVYNKVLDAITDQTFIMEDGRELYISREKLNNLVSHIKKPSLQRLHMQNLLKMGCSGLYFSAHKIESTKPEYDPLRKAGNLSSYIGFNRPKNQQSHAQLRENLRQKGIVNQQRIYQWFLNLCHYEDIPDGESANDTMYLWKYLVRAGTSMNTEVAMGRTTSVQGLFSGFDNNLASMPAFLEIQDVLEGVFIHLQNADHAYAREQTEIYRRTSPDNPGNSVPEDFPAKIEQYRKAIREHRTQLMNMAAKGNTDKGSWMWYKLLQLAVAIRVMSTEGSVHGFRNFPTHLQPLQEDYEQLYRELTEPKFYWQYDQKTGRQVRITKTLVETADVIATLEALAA